VYDWKPIIRMAQALYGGHGDGLFNTANFQNAFRDEIGCAIETAIARRVLKSLSFVRPDGHCQWRAINEEGIITGWPRN